ncbi:PfkB domain protein (fragment) [Desulfamplus magnetovallimortis]|uniref:PfkB domain protein n=1 Tax=Desulfamplus magnetovallimortis TaxID=1246637 RepID=A0A1W1HDA9_9BACT
MLSVITPDAQRSMFTSLGASTELLPSEVTAKLFEDTGIAVIEGYLLFNRDLMRAALDAAKKAGALVALDLASFEVINASMDILPDIIKNDVDILIANEDEARAYTGFSDETEAIEALSENVEIAVLKVGARGSYISSGGDVIYIKPVSGHFVPEHSMSGASEPEQYLPGDSGPEGVEILDTTGAGDLWAAGFLYGVANGLSLKKSGQIASVCGFEVCRVVGAQIPEEGWERILSHLR